MTKSEPSGSAKTGAMGLSRTWFGELFKTQIGFALQVGMPNNIPPPGRVWFVPTAIRKCGIALVWGLDLPLWPKHAEPELIVPSLKAARLDYTWTAISHPRHHSAHWVYLPGPGSGTRPHRRSVS
jgi:hypothetical protein